MTSYDTSDTIAAVATAPGLGGVAVIRVSGPASLELLGRLFRTPSGRPATFPPYTMRHGFLTDDHGRDLDEVLAVVMPGPRSFTGEDVVEIHCHGGRAVPRAVLETLTAAGARLARPGEFSLRAFLNGRMDLTRAEAVAEVVCAPSRKALELASGKLRGLLERRIADLRGTLEEARTGLCLAVDFPEEELECLPPEGLAAAVRTVLAGLGELRANYERGRPFREGAAVVLAGRVNAGKSSLLNAFLGRERAIVTDIPGTTRDFLEETVLLEGLPVRLVDTAGLRETRDVVEAEGVRASHDLAEGADLVLLVVDGSAPFDPADLEFALAHGRGGDRIMVALNKADLAVATDYPSLEFTGRSIPAHRISARTGLGLQELGAAIRELLLGRGPEPEAGDIVPNLRQCEAMRRASEELEGLLADLSTGVPYDLLGVRLEMACAVLSEITGQIHSEDILNRIFSSFCIGK